MASQSLYSNPATKDGLLEAIADVESKLEVYIEWSRHDYLLEDVGIDAARDSQEVAELLERRGHDVRRNPVTGAAGWGSWRAQLDTILELFYPLEGGGG